MRRNYLLVLAQHPFPESFASQLGHFLLILRGLPHKLCYHVRHPSNSEVAQEAPARSTVVLDAQEGTSGPVSQDHDLITGAHCAVGVAVSPRAEKPPGISTGYECERSQERGHEPLQRAGPRIALGKSLNSALAPPAVALSASLIRRIFISVLIFYFFRIPFASPTCPAAASCCVWCTKNDLTLVLDPP